MCSLFDILFVCKLMIHTSASSNITSDINMLKQEDVLQSKVDSACLQHSDQDMFQPNPTCSNLERIRHFGKLRQFLCLPGYSKQTCLS